MGDAKRERGKDLCPQRLVGGLVFLCLLLSGVAQGNAFQQQLVSAALERTQHQVSYNGAYYQLDYPNGDVPANMGVCTDVIIRAYRAVGTDLQVNVHEDMAANFAAYPSRRIWGLSATDRNIDHRRVPNLQAFFRRHGEALPISQTPADYAPGDMVTWRLPGNLPHIGIVTDRRNEGSDNPLIVHNMGAGPVLEDMLFDYPITGHFRYSPSIPTGSTR